MYRNYVIIAYSGADDVKLTWYCGSFEGAKKRALDVYNHEGAKYVEIATADVRACVDYNGCVQTFDKSMKW